MYMIVILHVIFMVSPQRGHCISRVLQLQPLVLRWKNGGSTVEEWWRNPANSRESGIFPVESRVAAESRSVVGEAMLKWSA